MNEADSGPPHYKVVYSGLVREELKQLLYRTRDQHRGAQTLRAIKELDRRLRIYPQFGEELQDLQMEGQTRWIATVPPFVVDYIIDEINRMVFIIVPLKMLQ